MPKKQGWERGLGVYSERDAGLTRAPEQKDGDRDISKVVERNANRTDGSLDGGGK